jgi:hypothetical protein
MPTLQPKIIIKAYLILILVIGLLVSPLPQFGLALMLLIFQFYTIIKPLKPNVNTAILMATLILAPLTLVPVTGNFFSALYIIPPIYLLDQTLKDNNQNQPVSYLKTQRNVTDLLKKLATALFVAFAAALTLGNITLLISTGTVIVYLTAVVSYNILKIPQNPLKETKTWNRIIVGNTTSNRIQVSAKTDLPLTTVLTAKEPWIQVKPTQLTLERKNQAEVNLVFTPPLAGPSTLQLQATVVDARGLIQFNQILEPVDLHIIPRAKYAEWLAKKYLKQTASGSTTAAVSSAHTFRVAKQGIEYVGNRLYAPGDTLKNIDWKHTLTIGELIVKEYAGAMGQPVIITADLTAKNREDADKLAYNLAMTALTSATEALPSALAVYNQNGVIAATALTNPRETLKETLKITQKIAIADFPVRVTQPTEIYKLKRAIDKNQTETNEKLTEFLEFEYEVTESTIKMHPANKALTKCIDKTPPPAIITVASNMDYDVDAGLTGILEKLKKKGYSTITVKT